MIQKAKRQLKGTVYLEHFDRKYGRAGHYLGFATEGNLEARLKEHAEGKGARLTQVVTRVGITLECVRTWENATRSTERALKNRKDARSLCPKCCEARKDAGRFYRAMVKLGVRRISWN